eukprot:311752_1
MLTCTTSAKTVCALFSSGLETNMGTTFTFYVSLLSILLYLCFGIVPAIEMDFDFIDPHHTNATAPSEPELFEQWWNFIQHRNQSTTQDALQVNPYEGNNTAPSAPSKRQTKSPTIKPTRLPTSKPTRKPSREPTHRPTKNTNRWTKRPTTVKLRKPSKTPTVSPTKMPTLLPTNAPTKLPSFISSSDSSSNQLNKTEPFIHYHIRFFCAKHLDDHHAVEHHLVHQQNQEYDLIILHKPLLTIKTHAMLRYSADNTLIKTMNYCLVLFIDVFYEGRTPSRQDYILNLDELMQSLYTLSDQAALHKILGTLKQRFMAFGAQSKEMAVVNKFRSYCMHKSKLEFHKINIQNMAKHAIARMLFKFVAVSTQVLYERMFHECIKSFPKHIKVNALQHKSEMYEALDVFHQHLNTTMHLAERVYLPNDDSYFKSYTSMKALKQSASLLIVDVGRIVGHFKEFAICDIISEWRARPAFKEGNKTMAIFLGSMTTSVYGIPFVQQYIKNWNATLKIPLDIHIYRGSKGFNKRVSFQRINFKTMQRMERMLDFHDVTDIATTVFILMFFCALWFHTYVYYWF